MTHRAFSITFVLTLHGRAFRIAARSTMLHSLRPASGSRKTRKRVGRGNSGGGGTTAGRGTKGQHSRVGKGRKHGFEGGQVPLIRRQPKLGGFKAPRAKEYEVVNLSSLETLDAGSYTVADLKKKRLVRKGDLVKVLGEGSISKKLQLEVHAASKSAKEAIAKAGGTLTIIRAAR
jgi:large subunit ribosomal protein L15